MNIGGALDVDGNITADAFNELSMAVAIPGTWAIGDGTSTLSIAGNLTVESASLINQDLTTDSATAELATLDLTTNTALLQVDGTTFLANDGTNNLFLGEDAFDNASGTSNIGIGYHAGYNNSVTGGGSRGTLNVYIGSTAGAGLSGVDNTGYRNFGLGIASLYNNTSGYSNVAIGAYSLTENLGGRYNIAIGENSLFLNETGEKTVAIGTGTLQAAGVGGGGNVAVGYRASYGAGSNFTYNVALGFEAGYLNTTGSANVFVGRQSGYSHTSGHYNIFLGNYAGYRQTTLSNLLIVDNQQRADAATELTNSILYGVMAATPAAQTLGVNAKLTVRQGLAGIPDEITATGESVAASIATMNTEVTTNGDSDLDDVTLANGTSGQVKHIYCVVEGNAADTWKITPATMCGGTQITFAGVGQGCTLIYADNEGWVVTANNGGTIS